MTLSRPGIVLALALAAAAPVSAQEPTPGRPIRLLLASTKLAAVTDEPLHFRLVRVTVPAGQSFAYAGPHGMICPVVGGLSVTMAGERKSVQEGEAVYVARGQQATLTAGQGGPATFLPRRTRSLRAMRPASAERSPSRARSIAAPPTRWLRSWPDCEGAGPHGPAVALTAGGSGDRVTTR
jgi:hypothetical protein